MGLTRRDFLKAGAMGAACVMAPGGVFGTETDLRNRSQYSSFMIEAETGRVLSQRRADIRRPPASFVKVPLIMLAFDAIEAGTAKWDDEVTVTPEMTAVTDAEEDYYTRFLPKKTMSLREHIDAMIVKSMNESAMAVAAHLAGSERDCAALIEEKLRAVGAERTTIRNATGYHHPEQLTTARDQALVAQHLVYAYAAYYPLFAQTSVEFGGNVAHSHNQYILNGKDRDGIKTARLGITGNNLIGSAKTEDGRRVIVVAYGGDSGKEIADHAAWMTGLGFERHSREFRGLSEPVSATERERNILKLSERAPNPFGRTQKAEPAAPALDLRPGLEIA